MESESQNPKYYDNVLDTSELPTFNKFKLIRNILIIVILIGLIGLIVISYTIFANISNNSKNTTSNNTIKYLGQSQKTIQDTKIIRECLKMEKFDSDCNMLFSNPDIEEKCGELTKLKDKCFYKIAIIYARLDLCWEIENKSLEQNCETKLNNLRLDIPINSSRSFPQIENVSE